jgi:hypothetical protein
MIASSNIPRGQSTTLQVRSSVRRLAPNVDLFLAVSIHGTIAAYPFFAGMFLYCDEAQPPSQALHCRKTAHAGAKRLQSSSDTFDL